MKKVTGEDAVMYSVAGLTGAAALTIAAHAIGVLVAAAGVGVLAMVINKRLKLWTGKSLDVSRLKQLVRRDPP